ncbi:DNA-3-methyladenine glycosylase family protein [Stutzerimonas tarimensis]|uniref:DNA-3-methyladenine glycosylase II n=1 Tax=Stutzerimonas tarimensis TaxID=1507735 RepID=A0ABV7T9P2_9GAMM
MSRLIHLPYQPPWDWGQFQQHFALRLLPGVEKLDETAYSRTLHVNGNPGWLAVQPLAERPALILRLSDSVRAEELVISARVRKMFDLDRDPAELVRHFSADPALGAQVAAHPGLRLPAAFDPFEQAVRAIIGQQVSVKAAVTITRRLVDRLGEPLSDPQMPLLTRLFPTAQAIAGATLDKIGMPAKRLAALQGLAAAVADGALELHADEGHEAFVRRLCELPGIGPWTAEYIALRGFGEADAFPASDLGLIKAPLWGPRGLSVRELTSRAESWRPYRGYAAIHLWHAYARGG